MVAWIKIPHPQEVGLRLTDCVRWGPSPLPKKGVEPPKFSADVDCGQTAGCIKMALGMEVGLGDIVLDEDAALHERGMSVVATVAHLSYC